MNPQEAKAGLAMIQAVAETIREFGTCPTGPMYAALMGRVSLEGFEKILGILERAGLIKRDGNMVTWVK